jgi:drug/metabolite transporter, DME family
MTSRSPDRSDRTWLVALAAGLWGTDGLLRKPLADQLAAASVVFWEHLIALAVLAPKVPSSLRALRRCTPREQIAVVVIGAGASALATALFTHAFNLGDPITPLVLQKLQPLFAVVAAFALLGERLRPGFAWFALPALAGAWLLAFADPLDVSVKGAEAALYSLGAAALWAGGTVLGRYVSRSLSPGEVTVLRYTFGLPAAAVILLVDGSPLAVGWGNAIGLVLLALVPGLLALSLYYVGLRATPASRATFAELAFPLVAAVVGVVFLGATLSGTQWLGAAVIVLSVTGLGMHERRRPAAVIAPPPPPARRPSEVPA